MTHRNLGIRLMLALSACALALSACGARQGDGQSQPAASGSNAIGVEAEQMLDELGRELEADTFEDARDLIP